MTHLPSDRLLEVALERAPSSAEREHLAACAVCSARQDEFSRLLDDAAKAVSDEADAVFTPERLVRQRTRILERLEQEGRTAKVVSFPAGHTHHVKPLRKRPGMSWVAGAAAAGIIVGMLAGHYAHDFRMQNTRVPPMASTRSPDASLQTDSATVSDEEFLGRLQMAIEGTSGSTLQALHELTPLVWEVSAP
jgi:hypothetical protein